MLLSLVEFLDPSTSTSHYAQAISNNVGAQMVCLWMPAFSWTAQVQCDPTFAINASVKHNHNKHLNVRAQMLV
jgi:hypothetical protein